MPPIGPIHRRLLIAYLRQLGFESPISGGRHQYMLRGGQRLFIPNPHRGQIGRVLLQEILRQAGISREEWEAL